MAWVAPTMAASSPMGRWREPPDFAQRQDPADLGLGVHLAGALLEAPDEHHLGEQLARGLLVGQVMRGLLDAGLLRLSNPCRVLGGHRPGGYPVPAATQRPRVSGCRPGRSRTRAAGWGRCPEASPGRHRPAWPG